MYTYLVFMNLPLSIRRRQLNGASWSTNKRSALRCIAPCVRFSFRRKFEFAFAGCHFRLLPFFSISVPEQDANWDASPRPSPWDASSWGPDEWPTFCNASRGRVKPQMRFSTTVTRSRNRGIVSTCARAASTWKAPLPSALFHNISIFPGISHFAVAVSANSRSSSRAVLADAVVRRNVMERLIKSSMENLFFSTVKLSE